ncbi:hypothetical protein [Microbacterium sp. VKM Ac-2923]|uniref:hypothetical protein n=1 Tax=Microbacterium sp. VKM Ac-2923 TaxID=2929476 RepID=UPI001FB37792|nr:hypothetical protein [Microbacterium sp. VKM Ac-2923]MCJ1708618.1 hypothetical protein [Microbacterium sp. VKM Ac-2923]
MHSADRRHVARLGLRRGVLAVAVGVTAGLTIFGLTGGTGTLLATTSAAAAESSAVTVTARQQDSDVANAPFPDLSVTVSQTRALEAQGIVVSWTGGTRSTVPNSQIGGADFLQVFQCWGDDPARPGTPDRTTCQYGMAGVPGSHRDGNRENDASVADEDKPYSVPGSGFTSPTYTAIPFRAADGTLIAAVKDGAYNLVKDTSGNEVLPEMNDNEFFSKFTNNMVTWAGSGGDGSGSVKFEVQTAMQSQGLGCGAPVTGADGAVTGKSCWLVIVPRGKKDSGSPFITQSGLFWDAWKHRIAVELDFKPLGTRCPIGAAERLMSGSELIGRAVSSWQPAVCQQAGGSIYSALTGAESDAALAANGTAAAPLALTSRALDPDLATDSLRYAPIGITGAAISFAIDRNPRPGDSTVPEDVQARIGLPFESLKLTPRLVAKLLTNSYLDSLPTFADRDHLSHLVDTGEVGEDEKPVMKRVYNPRNLTTDPEFLAINDPEWAHQSLATVSLADMLVPQGRSDVAWALWTYVVSDDSARAFLEGTPDETGMTVNPWSATTAEANRSGLAMRLPREEFPKADPVEQAETSNAGPVNLVTWRPYTNDFDAGAYDTLRGDGLILGGWEPGATPPRYGKSERQLPGQQSMLALTDTASAARYQVVTAELRNPAGNFVAATAQAMAAAADAMVSDPRQGQVMAFDPASPAARQATGAYPLTLPVYAAANPLMKDAELRRSYAAFIRFASTTGQSPGTSLGQLPEGYVPLPDSWRSRAAMAADDIELGRVPTTVTEAPAATGGVPFPAGGVVGSARAATSPQTAAAPAAETTSPAAEGSAAAALAGGVTPADPDPGALTAALPLSVLGGLACALTVPLFGRLRRRL